MVKTIQQKRQDYLTDMLAYYTADVNRRNVTDDERGACMYASLHSLSEGCAIGRRLPRELAVKLDTYYGISSFDMIFAELPDWMQELGDDFLVAIQRLHDYPEYWDETGLTGRGLQHIQMIKTEYIDTTQDS